MSVLVLFLQKELVFIDIKKWQFTQPSLNLKKFIHDTVGYVDPSRIIGAVNFPSDKFF